jgi:chromosome partitioning protein
MHLISALLSHGYRVGSIDVDARQGTLSRYIENRHQTIKTSGLPLSMPQHFAIFRSQQENLILAREEEDNRFNQTIEQLKDCQFIVIDTPGSDTHLSRVAHSYADTLITPLNDSFIDLDMLVRVEQDSLNILKPSTYSEMVWDQKKQRAMRDGGKIDWIVLRNRLPSIHSRNKEDMDRVLKALSKRIGFRLLPGFGERVIFRELFLSGLTLLDMRQTATPVTLSHLSGKQELASLMAGLSLPAQLQEVRVAQG